MLRMPSDLFGHAPDQRLPPGFKYQPDVIEPGEERELIRSIEQLPLKEFEFQGFLGKRRVVSFGWRYDFNGGGLQKTEDIPDVLLPKGLELLRLPLGTTLKLGSGAVIELRGLRTPCILIDRFQKGLLKTLVRRKETPPYRAGVSDCSERWVGPSGRHPNGNAAAAAVAPAL